MNYRVRWALQGAQKEGDITPTVLDSGECVLPQAILDEVKAGTATLTAADDDVVAKFVVEAALSNIAFEQQVAEAEAEGVKP